MPSNETWTPTQDDIEWTKKVINGLVVGQDWMEGEMAFRKTAEEELTLLTRTERAYIALERVQVIIEMLGWNIKTESAKIIPDDPQAAAEAIQDEVQGWVCPACKEVHVVDMDLKDVRWKEMGNTVYVDEEGESVEKDRWVISVTCECKEELFLSPDDYYLAAGDTNFYRWVYDDDGVTTVAQALSTEEIIYRVDSGTSFGNTDHSAKEHCEHLGTTFQGNTVPPHMRGTYCHFSRLHAGEEEE